MSDIFNILLEGGDVDSDGPDHLHHGFDGGGFGPGVGHGRAGGGGGINGDGGDGLRREKKRRNRKVRWIEGV